MATNITKEKLDYQYQEVFNKERFLRVDPCGLVYELCKHTTRQLDIELGALFVAMITWGNRKAIRKAALRMLQDEMQWHPAEFVLSNKFADSYATAKNECVYRTLNVSKFKEVCHNLQQLIAKHDTLEDALSGMSIEQCIATLTEHLAPAKLGTSGKSACKRICMFLRWMIRREEPDLGLWTKFSQRNLYAVMDVHVCQLTAPILSRKQADWKSCCELTNIFREWNSNDPLRYDIALMTLADNGDSTIL